MDHWVSTKLKELVTFVIGGDWGKDPSTTDDDYVDVYCIRGTELRDWHSERGSTAAHRKIKRSSLAKRRLHEGDLILEVSGGGPEQPVGRVECIDRQVLAQNPEYPKICTNFFRRLEITNGVSSIFLAWYLKYFYQTGAITNYQAGSNNLRNLKYPDYEQLLIPLPALNEQSRIVEKIETLFARLDKGESALREVQKLLARYRQSVLKAAVTGQLTADWRAENAHRLEHGRDLLSRILKTRRETWQGRGRYKEPAAPDTTDLPELPEGWVWASLGQLCTLHNGDRGKNYPSKKDYTPEGAPFVNAGHIDRGKISMLKMNYISDERYKLLRAGQLKKDDIVYCIRGSLGKFAICDLENGAIASSLVILRTSVEGLAPYLMAYLGCSLVRDEIAKYDNGTAQPNLAAADVAKFAVPFPGMGEQRQITSLLDETCGRIETLSRWCQTEMARSAALRKSILKAAFAGRLVPQDPADEPAADLLARIRETRDAAPAKTQRKARA